MIVRSASDTGILYGSVTTRDISNLIGENGVNLSRKHIALEKPIKELGIFDIRVLLHPEVESTIKLKVVRSMGDTASIDDVDTNADSTSGYMNTKLNEALLEDGVSLKTEETNSEELEVESEPDDKSTE